MDFNVVELFSGIGAQAKALKRVALGYSDINLNFLATAEWDIRPIIAYNLIHYGKIENKYKNINKIRKFLADKHVSVDGKNPVNKRELNYLTDEICIKVFNSIVKTNNLISVKDIKGEDLPNDISLLTYSFPCTDLSKAGNIHGFNRGIDRDSNTRSGLLWEVERILNERVEHNLKLPKFLLLENVLDLLSKRHKADFNIWLDELQSMHYFNCIFKTNSFDCGSAQVRKRLIVLSILYDSNKELEEIKRFYNERTTDLENNIVHGNLALFLRTNYQDKEIFKEALTCQPNDTPSRRSIWEKNPILVDDRGNIANFTATITTKQDRHPNSGNIYFDYPGNIKSHYRFLTPRECLLLMGFDENDYLKIINNNLYTRKGVLFFGRDNLYKLFGNSIVVNVLERIFGFMFKYQEYLNKKINNEK